MKRILLLLTLSFLPQLGFAVNSNRIEGEEPPTQTTGYDNGHEWVDLGLPSGTKWAKCNVGASSPEDYGGYYAWGETVTKSDYSENTLKYCTDKSGHHFNKYVPSDRSNYWSGSGSPDNKVMLEFCDDAANINWSGNWRIPSKAQWQELSDDCIWSWSGVGYKVTGPNGQSIHLPAAGFRIGRYSYYEGSDGYYWSSSLSTERPDDAWNLYFDGGDRSLYCNDRRCGGSVRPVIE